MRTLEIPLVFAARDRAHEGGEFRFLHAGIDRRVVLAQPARQDFCRAQRPQRIPRRQRQVRIDLGTRIARMHRAGIEPVLDAVVHTAFPMAMRERSLETGAMVDYLAGLFNLLKESMASNALFVYIHNY